MVTVVNNKALLAYNCHHDDDDAIPIIVFLRLVGHYARYIMWTTLQLSRHKKGQM